MSNRSSYPASMTEEQFAHASRFMNPDGIGKLIAKSVLVDGVPASNIAASRKITVGYVYSCVKRVTKRA